MNLRRIINFSGVGETLRRVRLSALEIIFLVTALVFVALVISFYLTKVQPLNSEMAGLKNRETELRTRLQKMTSDEKKRLDQASNAEKIIDSLGKFQGYLKPDERGMTQIINEIDNLGRTHKVIVGDASYRPLEPEATAEDDGSGKAQKASYEKKINLYPSLGIDTTVIGDYLNLRGFLADLERSNQFLIINSLSFQGEAEKVRQMAARGGQAQQIQLSGPEAVPVSLKIEMDTYFRRPAETR